MVSKYGYYFFFFFQAEDGIRDKLVTGVQTCALPIYPRGTQRNPIDTGCRRGCRCGQVRSRDSRMPLCSFFAPPAFLRGCRTTRPGAGRTAIADGTTIEGSARFPSNHPNVPAFPTREKHRGPSTD